MFRWQVEAKNLNPIKPYKPFDNLEILEDWNIWELGNNNLQPYTWSLGDPKFRIPNPKICEGKQQLRNHIAIAYFTIDHENATFKNQIIGEEFNLVTRDIKKTLGILNFDSLILSLEFQQRAKRKY